MNEGNVFNLFKLKTGEKIYKGKRKSISEINDINGFDFSSFLNGTKYKPIEVTKAIKSLNKEISIDFYAGEDNRKNIAWNDLYEKISGESCNFQNLNHSYILFIYYNGKHGRHLFAVTGGNGHHKIKNSIDNTFAFSLINKLIEDTSVFGSVKQNTLVGTETYIERGFQNEHDVLSENNYWTVNKEANIKIPKDKLLELGIDIKKREKAGATLSKGFKINKKISYNNLIEVILSVVEKLKGTDKIKMNRILAIEDASKITDLKYELFRKIKNKPEEILILPDNEKLFFSCDTCFIDINGDHFEIDSISQVLRELKNKDKVKFKSSFEDSKFIDDLEEINRAHIYFDGFDINLQLDSNIEKFKLLKSIYGNIKLNGKEYIYIHGDFYSLDINVLNLIKSDFLELLNDYGSGCDKSILSEPWLKNMKEEEYLDLYKDKDRYFLLDKFTPENIEFCDLMHITNDGKIYLIHAKDKFGNVSRDHSLQALMSAEKIVHNINSSNKTFFELIYEHCSKNFGTKFTGIFGSKSDFIEKISNKDDIYILLITGYKSWGGDLSKSKSYIGKVSMLYSMQRITYTLGFKMANTILMNK